jgi:cytochrome b6
MTLFFFLVQVVTGILLMLYYRPSADAGVRVGRVHHDHRAVRLAGPLAPLLVGEPDGLLRLPAPGLGLLPQGLPPPRELTWVTGALSSSSSIGFGFSGYLLPWNQLAFFATKVGTDIAGSVPLVGDWLLRFLRGGDRVTGGTLSRFYGWHVAILPALTTLLLVLHLLLVQIHGMSVPPAGERPRPARAGRCASSRTSPCATSSAGSSPSPCSPRWRRSSPGSWARRPIPSRRPTRTSGRSGTSCSCSRR